MTAGAASRSCRWRRSSPGRPGPSAPKATAASPTAASSPGLSRTAASLSSGLAPAPSTPGFSRPACPVPFGGGWAVLGTDTDRPTRLDLLYEDGRRETLARSAPEDPDPAFVVPGRADLLPDQWRADRPCLVLCTEKIQISPRPKAKPHHLSCGPTAARRAPRTMAIRPPSSIGQRAALRS